MQTVLGEFKRKDRLRNLTRKLLIAVTSGELWAALKLQHAWSRYVQKYLTIAPVYPEVIKTPAEQAQEEETEKKRQEVIEEGKRAGFAIVPDAPDAPLVYSRPSLVSYPEELPAADGTSTPRGDNESSGTAAIDDAIGAVEARVLRQVTTAFAQLRLSLQQP